MQVVGKTLVFVMACWIGAVLFMPTKEIYFAIERVLAAKGIEINEKSISEKPGRFDIDGATLFFEGMPIASVEHTECRCMLPYIRISLSDIAPDSELKRMFPGKISRIVLRYLPQHLSKVEISAEGSFGKAEGVFDFVTRRIVLRIVEAKEIGALRSYLKHDKKGWYYDARL